MEKQNTIWNRIQSISDADRKRYADEEAGLFEMEFAESVWDDCPSPYFYRKGNRVYAGFERMENNEKE